MRLFTSTPGIRFSDFIEKVKSGAANILSEVGLSESTFETMPYQSILDNPSDVAAGVNKVKLKTKISAFEVFDSVLIKYYDNGEVKYLFYTTSKDHLRINELSKTLFEKLGPGVYDSDHDLTFKNSSNIIALAGGKSERDVRNVWLTEKYSVVIQYRTQPLHQFALILTQQVERLVDTSSRRGTVYDLLPLDLNKIFLQKEISVEANFLDDGSVNCIDYRFKLDYKILNAFDTITIRLFSNEREFTIRTQTHLKLTCSKDIPLRTKLEAIQTIQAIYGSDWTGCGDLDIGEVDIIENNDYWTGRRWHLNEVHGLHLPGDNSSDIYWVEVTNSTVEDGLMLYVGCYNKLIEYFTVE